MNMIKKIKDFNFLEFLSSRGARRLLPLCSVFIVAFFVIMIPVKSVYAFGIGIPIPAVPYLPYNTESIEPNYEVLNDDQKKIVHEILGINSTIFFGLANFPYTVQNIGQSLTREKLQEVGRTFINTLFDSVVGSPRAIQDLVGSVTYKASQYESYSDYQADTTTVDNGGNQDHFYLEYPKELTVGYKNWFNENGGVYDWQFKVQPFTSNTVYTTTNITDIQKGEINSGLAAHGAARVRFNYPSSTRYNCLASGGFLETYTNIFVNTSDSRIYLAKDDGTLLNDSSPYDDKVIYVGYIHTNFQGQNVVSISQMNIYPFPGNHFYYSYNDGSYNSYLDLVKALYNHVGFSYNNPYNWLFFEDFVNHVYVGANWYNKQELYNIDDLDIGPATSNYIDNISDTAYIDATGVIDDMADGITDTTELVDNNVLVKQGEEAVPISEAVREAIDKYMSTPSSGVVINPGLFSPLSKYISYLWQFTKPLVTFTTDLLSSLAFDDNKGLAWIVYGTVAVGLISGMVSRFLL